MITFLASVLIWLMFFGLIVLWVIDGKFKKELVLHAVFASLVAWIITDLIKLVFPSLRPFQVNGFEALTIIPPSDGSFPSAHTAAAFALASTIFAHHKKVGYLYLIMAALVGIARIAANVHYPIDIIGGAIVGLLSSRLTSSKHFARLLKR